MNNNPVIVGVGATPVVKADARLEHEMIISALVDAITDANINKNDIDSLIFSTPRPYTKQRYFGTFVAGYLEMPLSGLLAEVLGNGMTGALALEIAIQQIKLGRARVAVALGVSKESMVATAEHMNLTMRAVGDVDFHAPLGVTPISWYALNATRYFHDCAADRTVLADIAVKNRNNAILNPIAQLRKPISREDVLSARPIVKPLGLLDVPPRSDGAVAVIVADEEYATKSGCDIVHILSSEFYHEGVHQLSPHDESLISFKSAKVASSTAYEVAGIGPEDIDFAEVYAPCTIVELILSESLGLFESGGGGAEAVRRGLTTIRGSMPISTSGGCTSRGHPPMVTPLYNAYEAVLQLRNRAGRRQVENAKIGLITGELGDYNATMVTILSNTNIGSGK